MAYNAELGEKAETKNEKFKRLAEKRTNAVLEKVRVLANLSNRSQYEYSEEEVEEIYRAIERELRKTKSKFLNKGRANQKFTFGAK